LFRNFLQEFAHKKPIDSKINQFKEANLEAAPWKESVSKNRAALIAISCRACPAPKSGACRRLKRDKIKKKLDYTTST
jgi:hypothetical protein